MANRNWRSGGYQTFNQILTPMSYYQQPINNFQSDRKTYGGSMARGGYREDYYKRDRKEFQSNRRDRISPVKRRSPPTYQRSHETTHNDNYRKDFKKSSHGGGRYDVKAPRLTFDIKDLSTTTLKFRYPKISVPSEFFHTHLNVQEAFPLYRPMKLGNHCEFQVLSKEIESDVVESDVSACAEPSDANVKYSAKVMLMSSPALPELYKSVCHLSESGDSKLSLIKNIKFLVGSKSKNEPMAIGGPWSPSLDGSDPEEDPYVLVNTAIRTCKALTGIDLSNCKKWYKFLDIQYYRQPHHQGNAEDKTDEAEVEPVVESVTIYIPDIWSCMPTETEWTEVKTKYEKKLQSLLNPKVEEPTIEEKETNAEEKVEDKIEETLDKVEEVTDKTDGESELDLNQLKVTELRAQLTARGLEPKGLKLQLVQRLQEAIDNDKKKVEAKVEMKDEGKPVEVTTVKENEEVKVTVIHSQLPEKEQVRLEKLYKINETPSILVHVNKTIDGGKFECSLMSLDSLLDYRGDQKEASFEVALFAEQFHEMLQRDAAFTIYKSLTILPELVKDSVEPETKKARIEVAHDNIRKSKVIADMHLLFAFCVFDTDNIGYIRDHELENIFHCIGLNLSRSQVKKLLAKIPSKKGNIFYKDVVEREVIEGSPEDIATLKTADVNMDMLVELAQGNRSFFDECDTRSLATRTGSLALLDKLNAIESKKLNHELQSALLISELNKLKAAEVGSGDVETHLRENIKRIEDKLVVEKETLSKLSEVAKVYSGLLSAARDHMGASITSINEQFDHEKQLADEIKAKEDEEAAKVKAAAAKEKEEAAAAKEKEEAEKAAQEAVAEETMTMEVDDSAEKEVVAVDEKANVAT